MPERFLGRTLGKYRVDELVGSGGFAWVYKAFDPELEIDVALKVLKPQFAGDPQVEERFRREASTAAKLRHPNIITIHAVGRDGDAVYFAMDYLPDGLAQRLETVAFLPEESVVRVGIDVAAALGFAHRQGVIHRDIKVDNILFDAHGNAVVADFGIARAVTGVPGHTGTNMVVGTPQYFAPEQARAKPLDGRADLYSLGVTLFRAATGQLPFTGDDWYEIARQHVEVPPPSPRSINPALTDGFDRAILHCLEKSADDRPSSGEALRQELVPLLDRSLERTTLESRIASDQPTLVVDATPFTETKRRRLMPRLVASGAVLGLIVLAIIAFVRGGGANGAQPVTMAPSPDMPPIAESTTVATPVPRPADSVTKPRTDSVVSTTLLDSSAMKAKVLVTAPAGASIAVNRVAVGTGSWRADTMKRGAYEFTAVLPGAPDGCESARVSESRTLRPGKLTTIALEPRSCGFVTFEAIPKNATYSLVSLSDNAVHREGTMPLSAPLVVPPGKYRLTLEERQCVPFVDSMTVSAEQTTRPQKSAIKLFCGR